MNKRPLILEHLNNVKERGHGWRSTCPSHKDANPSLDIDLGDDGRTLLKCRTGCTTEQIVTAAGLTMTDLFPAGDSPPRNNGNGKPPKVYLSREAAIAAIQSWPGLEGAKLVGDWPYHKSDGSESFSVLRFDKSDGSKEFRPLTPVKGGWIVKRPAGLLPAYNIQQIENAKRIYFCEGEKCCESGRSIGLPCTTSAFGSQSAKLTGLSTLKGKDVFILPDHDSAGEQYAETVAERLYEMGCRVAIVRLPDLPKGGDLVDYIEQHDSTDSDDLKRMIEALADQAEVWQPQPPIMQIETTVHNKKYQVKFTEFGLAEYLVELHGKDIRYCEKIGWLVWDDKRWLPDQTQEVERRAFQSIRSLHQVAAELPKEERQKLQKFADKSETYAKIKAVISVAKSLKGIAITVDRLDTHPWLLNCENGTVDLKTGKLLPHNRDHLITKMTGAAYHPDATSDVFDRFMADILPDPGMCAFALRAIGAAAVGLVRDHVLHFWYGNGCNGKSTLENIIIATLGDYAMTAPPRLLIVKKYQEHQTEFANLRGVRFVGSMETGENARLDEELVKRLTGGDLIKGRMMRQDHIEFPPSHTLFLGTNHRPKIRGTDYAMWRRIRLWPFMVQIKIPDLKLGEKLRAERDGILTQIVEGCLEWQKIGLAEPKEVLAATEEYKNESDVIQRFIDDRCIMANNAVVPAADLHEAYENWARHSGEPAFNQTAFGIALKEKGYEKKRQGKNRWTHYLGIALCSEVTAEGT